jgi:hypothetical protein
VPDPASSIDGDIDGIGRVRLRFCSRRRASVASGIGIVSWMVTRVRAPVRRVTSTFDEFADNLVAAGVVVAFLGGL